MYIPKMCPSLSEGKEPQIRLGIQGAPKTGKTWGALTFPNPLVIDIDRGLGSHYGKDTVWQAKLYDTDWCKQINLNYQGKHQMLDTLMMFLKSEATKMSSDQTLIFDGGTGFQNMYDAWYDANKVYTKAGKEDDFAKWRVKIEAYANLMEFFKTLKCNVVFITHESEKKDKDGGYSGKLRPLLTGQFQDQLASHFTDWVRQFAISKPDPTKLDATTIQNNWDMTPDEFKMMLDTFPRNTLYYWQLEGDDAFDGGTSSLINYPRFIPANYGRFKKYMKTLS